MADRDSNQDSDTGGGADVGGDVEAQTFVGRDVNLNLEIQATGAELRELAELLVALLSTKGTEVRDGKVVSGEQAVDIAPARVDALRQYLNRQPGVTQSERIDQYLLHLCVNPEFHQWQQRYVALSGGYRSVPELTPSYSAILVRGEGPQRQIERVPLDDIRDHCRSTNLHPAGPAGRGQDDRSAAHRAGQGLRLFAGKRAHRFRSLYGCRLSEVDESPRDFLVRMWREAMPGWVRLERLRCRFPRSVASGSALHPVRRPQRGPARRTTVSDDDGGTLPPIYPRATG